MTTQTMKAVRQHEFGGPEVLLYEDAPVPELRPGEGTVRVAIDSAFALADARKAHERAAQGHLKGKIVLTVR